MPSFDLLTCIAILLIAFAAGTVQTSTGFGAGIVMMTVLPSFFGISTAAALNTSVVVFLTISLVIRFRKDIEYRHTLPLIACYLVTSIACIRVTPYIDTQKIGIGFGIFLIAISVFFLFFSSRITLSASLPMTALCGFASGVFSGFFGVGGPLVAIYLLNTSRSKDSYLANTQFIFLMTGIVNTLTRAFAGIYTASLLPFAAIGLVGILLGKKTGLFISRKIKPKRLKLLVYIFVGIAGLLTLKKYLI